MAAISRRRAGQAKTQNSRVAKKISQKRSRAQKLWPKTEVKASRTKKYQVEMDAGGVVALGQTLAAICERMTLFTVCYFCKEKVCKKICCDSFIIFFDSFVFFCSALVACTNETKV